MVGCQSLIDVLMKRDTMKQNLQGNILKGFPLIRLNVSDFSLLFNCIFYSGGKKNIDKNILPFLEPYPVSYCAKIHEGNFILLFLFCTCLSVNLKHVTVPRFPVDYE